MECCESGISLPEGKTVIHLLTDIEYLVSLKPMAEAFEVNYPRGRQRPREYLHGFGG